MRESSFPFVGSLIAFIEEINSLDAHSNTPSCDCFRKHSEVPGGKPPRTDVVSLQIQIWMYIEIATWLILPVAYACLKD